MIKHPCHTTIHDLVKKGIIVPGRKYVPAKYASKKVISLAKARAILAKIKGSLAGTLSQIRDEE